MPLHLCWKQLLKHVLGVFLNSLLYSIGIFVNLYANTSLSLLLQLYKESWNHVVKVLQLCSPFSKLSWPLESFDLPCEFYLFIFIFFEFYFIYFFIHQVLVSHPFYTPQCIHVNPNRPIHHTTTTSPPPLSPLGGHTFVLYICVSTSALQTGSSVPFF